MGARILLHVGLHKSGTTYLQHGFAGRAAELARAGLTYPVESPHAAVPNHQAAFYGMVPDEFGWLAERQTSYAGSWGWLRRTLAKATQPVLLSAEALSVVRAGGVARVVDGLGGPVRVLVTARPMDRLLASAWQQSVRNGRDTGLETFLLGTRQHREQFLADPSDEERDRPWRALSAASAVRRWSATPGVESVTLVVNSGRPADLLWTRMLTALDLPDGTTIAPFPVTDGNEGLRWAETDILAAVNRELSARPQYDRVQANAVRKAVITTGFTERVGRGPGVTLPADWWDEVAGWAEDEVREIAALGCRVVGPLDDLLPRPLSAETDTVLDLTAQDYSAAAAAALVGLVAQPAGGRSRMLRRALGSVRRAAG